MLTTRLGVLIVNIAVELLDFGSLPTATTPSARFMHVKSRKWPLPTAAIGPSSDSPASGHHVNDTREQVGSLDQPFDFIIAGGLGKTWSILELGNYTCFDTTTLFLEKPMLDRRDTLAERAH
jgi:hypothetical protein